MKKRTHVSKLGSFFLFRGFFFLLGGPEDNEFPREVIERHRDDRLQNEDNREGPESRDVLFEEGREIDVENVDVQIRPFKASHVAEELDEAANQ